MGVSHGWKEFLSSYSARCIVSSSHRRIGTGCHVACVSNLQKTKVCTPPSSPPPLPTHTHTHPLHHIGMAGRSGSFPLRHRCASFFFQAQTQQHWIPRRLRLKSHQNKTGVSREEARQWRTWWPASFGTFAFCPLFFLMFEAFFEVPKCFSQGNLAWRSGAQNRH